MQATIFVPSRNCSETPDNIPREEFLGQRAEVQYKDKFSGYSDKPYWFLYVNDHGKDTVLTFFEMHRSGGTLTSTYSREWLVSKRSSAKIRKLLDAYHNWTFSDVPEDGRHDDFKDYPKPKNRRIIFGERKPTERIVIPHFRDVLKYGVGLFEVD